MFTGIITGQARIAKLAPLSASASSSSSAAGAGGWGGDVRLELEDITGTHDYKNSAIGASICCSGVCLTLIAKDKTEKGGIRLAFDVSTETLAKTTIKHWQMGQKINLEPSLRFGDELGGHMVAGHVDTTVTALAQIAVSESTEWWFSLPQGSEGLIAAKGSVTLDGVSLTVNLVERDRFSVMIIPHTATITSFGTLRVGGMLNLEYDLFARYVARQLALHLGK